MLNHRQSGSLAQWLRGLGGLCIFVFTAFARGQELPRQALSGFPADTQQAAYVNLAELRSSPNYPQIRERVLNRQLRYFQDFLRAVGIDPDKDVDEAMLGWRGEASGPAGCFGMATGRFQPERIRQYFTRTQLPSRRYAGFDMYAFGSGEDPADVFFVLLDSSLAAFGRLPDLQAMLDVRLGSATALDANSAFVNWEGELEGTAPQWGILGGKAAANLAAAWFVGGKKQTVDPSALLRPVQAVLYRIQWDTGFSTQLAMVCQDAESASALATLLNLLRAASQHSSGDGGPAMGSLLQSAEAHTNGSRLELKISGPVEALEPILQGSAADMRP